MVPILTYHSLDDSGAVTSVGPREFRQHMRSLQRRGFTGISLSELLEGWETSAPLPRRPIVLTFDDGFANLVDHAVPLLAELKFRATVFAISGRCGQTNDWPGQAAGVPHLPLLTWSALAEMVAADWEVGAHSVTHRPLTEMSLAEATREIRESKTTIEDKLGREVKTFAYPFGLFTPAMRNVVREDFHGACSVRLARARAHEDWHELPRLDVYYVRRQLLFQLLETFPGHAYLALRRAGRAVRAGAIRN